MRKIMAVPLAAALLLTLLPMRGSAEDAEISAAAAIVMEPYTGTVLFEKDADARMLVASTTKIMTAMVVLEHCAVTEPVTVTMEHAAVEGSSMYLRPGEDYTVGDLLYGLLLASGNDAAAALADHCAGSMAAFAELMNQKCEALGLRNTHFANAHGLDAPEHYSTARELAVITAAAMENPVFCRIFSTRSATVRGVTYVNHNKLLTSCEGCIGGKTGYTEAAGRILVSCVEREGMRLICVTVSDPDDWADHAALYDACFSEWRFVPLPGERMKWLEMVSGSAGCVALVCDEPGLVVRKSAALSMKTALPRFVFAPVTAGEAVGEISVSVDGEPVRKIPIRCGETVVPDGRQGLTGWERFRRFWFLAGGIYYFGNNRF